MPTILSLAAAANALAAAGEETRLRILALIGETELTVSELVAILGQSQPRVSRHLKLLTEAGLAHRHREGAWAFFRAAFEGAGEKLAAVVATLLDAQDPILAADRARLSEIRSAREQQAARYFASHAKNWDQLRSLHAPESEVEAAMRHMVGSGPLGQILDCGSGSGRMLEIFAPEADTAIGVDLSPAMLGVARAKLDRAGVRNVQLRQGDIFALPVERQSFDLVIIHQVLHYLDEPARAIREASRALKPSGRMIVVDFAPHEEEYFRQAHAHRRLGFSVQEISIALEAAGLELVEHRQLAPEKAQSGKLTVSIWLARERRIRFDALTPSVSEFA